MSRRFHTVGPVTFSGDTMTIEIDGTENRFELSKVSSPLAGASAIERERYEVSPSGYGIHWPLLDEDLSIDGLLGIKHAPTQRGRVA